MSTVETIEVMLNDEEESVLIKQYLLKNLQPAAFETFNIRLQESSDINTALYEAILNEAALLLFKEEIKLSEAKWYEEIPLIDKNEFLLGEEEYCRPEMKLFDNARFPSEEKEKHRAIVLAKRQEYLRNWLWIYSKK